MKSQKEKANSKLDILEIGDDYKYNNVILQDYINDAKGYLLNANSNDVGIKDKIFLFIRACKTLMDYNREFGGYDKIKWSISFGKEWKFKIRIRF